jgi:hypothetical protein
VKLILREASISDILDHEYKIGCKTTSLFRFKEMPFISSQMKSMTLKGCAPSLMLACKFLANYEMFIRFPSLGQIIFLKSMFMTE